MMRKSVFDRILIEEIKKPVTYVVRDAPIINDATYEDAVQAGIDSAETINSFLEVDETACIELYEVL